jgi:hypothetical protein
MATGFRLSAPSEYRRGVVLGLTLAEVLVLLAFLLLLTMTALLLRREHEQAMLRQRAERDAGIVEIVRRAAVSQGLDIDDDRLATLIRDAVQAEALRSQLQEANSQLSEARVKLRDTGSQLQHANERLDAAAGAISENEAIAAVLERLPPKLQGGTPVERVEDLARKYQELVKSGDDQIKKDENLIGQNNQMRIELARLKGNGGSGIPYCWATPDGKPQYMLKIELHDDGVIIHDIGPRVRPEDRAWQLLESVTREQLMPLDDFIARTRSLRTSETADQCRYAVQALDLTGRTNKPGYKRSMGQLWTVFHVQEIHG